MSTFVKSVSIIGVIAIGIGIWQLTQSDGIGQQKEAEKTMKEDKVDNSHAYETVTLGKEEEQVSNLKRPDYNGETLVEGKIVQSIKEVTDENPQVRELIDKIGKDQIQDDLAYGPHSYDWDKLESENKEKQQWINQLLDLSDHKQLNLFAKEASRNFSKALKQKDLNYYFEAIKKFRYIDLEL
ncbi:hypothetical protein [Halobacillus sp. BBL2006]|uniref:hypothetical protein n=1 Tax=Halobacillus sp. BBL2006 TaxID=1543706 RepID=UPI00054265C1|nr:hypothetical protein [Halobacillus sp. BBL2006]KHE72323.1 hypothetical protein LD39_05165 [Halobacillus sp. BBL2006]